MFRTADAIAAAVIRSHPAGEDHPAGRTHRWLDRDNLLPAASAQHRFQPPHSCRVSGCRGGSDFADSIRIPAACGVSRPTVFCKTGRPQARWYPGAAARAAARQQGAENSGEQPPSDRWPGVDAALSWGRRSLISHGWKLPGSSAADRPRTWQWQLLRRHSMTPPVRTAGWITVDRSFF